MRTRQRHLATTALAVAAVATLVAVGSAAPGDAAYGFGHIARVGTAQLRKGAVTTAKLHKNAVTTAKLRNNAVTAAKLAPGARPQLPRGVSHGDAGETSIGAGQSKRVDAAMIAAGHWMIVAKGYVDGQNAFGRCDLVADGIPRDRVSIGALATGSPQTVSFSFPFMLGQAVDLGGETQIGIDCTATTNSITVRDTKILASQIRGIELVASSPP